MSYLDELLGSILNTSSPMAAPSQPQQTKPRLVASNTDDSEPDESSTTTEPADDMPEEKIDEDSFAIAQAKKKKQDATKASSAEASAEKPDNEELDREIASIEPKASAKTPSSPLSSPELGDKDRQLAETAFKQYEQNQRSRLFADSGFLPAAYANDLPVPRSIAEAKEALTRAPIDQLQGVNQYQGQAAKTSIEQMNADIEKQSNTPDSDISKFARMQMAAVLKRLNPNADVSALQNMTAAQIEKLSGSKVMGMGMQGRYSKTEYVTPDGEPLAQSNIDGSLVKATTGEPYSGPVQRSFMPTFINPQTGERVGYNALAPQGQQVMPLTGPTPHSQKAPPSSSQPDSQQSDAQPDILKTRKDLNTEDRKHLDKIQEGLNKDKSYADAKATVDEANQLKGLIQSGRDNIGPELIGAIQNKAVLSSGVKRITDMEVSRMPGGTDFVSKLNRWVATGSVGKLSDRDRQLFDRYADAMIRNSRNQINEASGQYVDQLASDLGVSRNQAVSLLGIQSRIDRSPAISGGEASGAEEERKTKDGRIAVFDRNTKKFLRYKQ